MQTKIDKFYKVLRIISITIFLVGLIWSLMHKIGLCASDSNISSANSLPLPVGAGWGNVFTDEEIGYIVNCAQQDLISCNDSGYVSIGAIIISEYSQDGSFHVRCYQGPGFEVSSPSTFLSTGSYLSWSFQNQNNYGGARELDFNSDGSFYSASWISNPGGITVNSFSFLSSLPDNSLGVVKGRSYTGYPIYISHDIIFNDVVYFSNNSSNGGFDSPGWSESFEEWINGDYNPIDTTPPSTDTTPAWLQKILNALGKLNNTEGAGFNLISGKIDSFFGGISDKIDDFKDFIEDKLSNNPLITFYNTIYDLGVSGGSFSLGTLINNLCFCSPETAKSIFDSSETGQAINSFMSCGRNIANAFTASPSQHVYWTFNFQNSVLSNAGTVTIDFDWYDSIRTPVITVFSVFFFLGFVFLIIRKIPGIISGSSSNSDDK